MITGINESDTLTKPVPCKCKYKFDDRKCNSNQNWNNDKCWCKCKKHKCEKDYIWNPAKCSCKNGKYLANIIEDSVIKCNEIKDAEAKSYNEETKTVTANFSEKKQPAKHKSYIFYLHFIALLIAVSIYCYLIKYKIKQKHLLPCYNTNNKFKKFCINNTL